MAPNTRRKRPAASLASHPTIGTAGNDNWQRQADAAAWSAVSGIDPSLYLGAIEPIPIPPDLRAKLREAGAAMAGDPSPVRADALLRLAHEAVYGAPMPGMPLVADPEPAGGVSGADWWDTPAAPDAGLADALAAFASESFAALQAADHDPADAGEASGEDWWT